MGHIKRMVETFAALGEPTRLRIVELLRSGPRPVNDIGERLELTQPQVSKHLRVLKDSGLVEERRQGTQRLYRARPEPILEMRRFLETFWDESLMAIKQAAEADSRGGKGG